VYKLDSFIGFIGDEQLHAQERYVEEEDLKRKKRASTRWVEMSFWG
jgi:hypothetical protein